MSYAAFKMMHWATGIENCCSGYLTHSAADTVVDIAPTQPDDLDPEWQQQQKQQHVARKKEGPLPNLVVSAGNVLEVYAVRVQEEDAKQQREGVMDGVSGARLELACHYRLHGNVESMAILSTGGDDQRRRDSIILTFNDSKVSVLEYDDSSNALRTSSMHCFEGPEWNYLKRGHKSFAHVPVVKTDPQGHCAGVLLYDLQMVILKACQTGHGFVGEDEASGPRVSYANCIESSYIISLRELNMKHVKDFTYIHGYIEPLMVILHETELTWAGRPWKHHTCMISAHSISTTLKQQPLIWSASNLPNDAFMLLAVPLPIGGVLVICANSIHYHSQSSSCSLGVNGFFASADGSSDVPRSSFNVELDASKAAWLSHDVAMFCTKNGELLLLMLIYDGRVMHRLDLSRSKASVLTSGITTIGNKFFFLGSRLGDSLLVQYNCGKSTSNPMNEKDEVADIESDGPPVKRTRTSSSDAFHDIMATDELSLFSSVNDSSESVQKDFSFAVRDSLVNVGPLKDFSYGLRINADPNAAGIAKQSNYELVCCSGHGKNGAICILQKSIRPELITEVELAGCKGIWTVYHKSSRSHASDSKVTMEDDEYHAYLIISLESRTMVLETADLLGEVTETVDYYVQGSTVSAGNLFGRRRVVQVFARGARILDGSYMTQEVFFGGHSSESSSIPEGLIVVSVSIADPYVLLRMSDGTLQLLIGDPSSCTVSVSVPVLSGSLAESISACTLYHDKGPEPWLHKATSDAWLSAGVSDVDGSEIGLHDQGDIYCIVCYECGHLEIFDIPGFKCIFTVKNFMSGKRHLIDASVCEPSKESLKISNGVDDKSLDQVKNKPAQSIKVAEVAMQRWSGQFSRPFLFGLLNDGTMLCYHAFLHEPQDNPSKIEGSLSSQNSTDASSTSRLRNLRFIRVSLDAFIHEESAGAISQQRMTIFKNVGGYQGLFLAGSRPMWFIVCRERLRIHPQLCDGSIVAFTVLHNVNCNHGLIYVTSQGFLKICQLPSAANYDNYWPLQKIPLRGTPHQITYYAERNIYPVIVSLSIDKPFNQVISSLAEHESSHQLEHDNMNSNGHQKYSTEEFEIRIFEPEKSTNRWETRATIPMQVSENALTVRMVTLLNSMSKENETLLAIGTAYVQGEDVAGRGRVLLFSFGKNLENSQNLVSEVYSKELKGAISAVSSLQGHLLVASGPKITLYKWTGNELIGVAFYDTPPLHAVSMNTISAQQESTALEGALAFEFFGKSKHSLGIMEISHFVIEVKNFILLGDIHKSIYFLNWKEQGAQLNLLAKDFGSLDCYATEFLIDGSTLSLVVSDEQKNIQIFYYAPKMSESWKGQKLLIRAEFHAGAHVTKFMRLQMLPVSSDRSSPASEKTNRFALLFGTLDGSIGCIAPLDELTFRRLEALQKKLVDAVPHVCGLNPRAFRHFRSSGRAHRPGPNNIVDFELLCCYEMLPLEEQHEIAHLIGTTRMQILSNMNDLSVGTSFL